MVAVHQDRIIGGVLFLEWKNGLFYRFNASSSAHLSLRPNDLVVWEGIKYGKAQGYSHLDFGLSDIVLSRLQHKVSSPGPEYEVEKRRLETPEITQHQV